MYRTILTVLFSAGALLQADGLTDLRKTLGQLHAETAVKGSLEIRTWNAREGVPDRQGVAHAWVEAGPEGLKVQLGKAILQALGEEARANRQDPEAPTPVTQGVKALEPSDLAEMVNAAPPPASTT